MSKLLDGGGLQHLLNRFLRKGLDSHKSNAPNLMQQCLRKSTFAGTLDDWDKNANTLSYTCNVWGTVKDGVTYIGLPAEVKGRFHLLSFNSGDSTNPLQNVFQILYTLDTPKGIYFRQSWDRWEKWYKVAITEVDGITA